MAGTHFYTSAPVAFMAEQDTIIRIESDCKLECYGRTYAYSSEINAAAIFVWGSLEIQSVDNNDAFKKLELTSQFSGIPEEDARTYGIYTNYGNYTQTGGQVSLSVSDYSNASFGLYADYDATVTGVGSLSIDVNSEYSGVGIQTQDGFNIDAKSQLYVTATTSALYVGEINCDSADTITGSSEYGKTSPSDNVVYDNNYMEYNIDGTSDVAKTLACGTQPSCDTLYGVYGPYNDGDSSDCSSTLGYRNYFAEGETVSVYIDYDYEGTYCAGIFYQYWDEEASETKYVQLDQDPDNEYIYTFTMPARYIDIYAYFYYTDSQSGYYLTYKGGDKFYRANTPIEVTQEELSQYGSITAYTDDNGVNTIELEDFVYTAKDATALSCLCDTTIIFKGSNRITNYGNDRESYSVLSLCDDPTEPMSE